MNCCPECFGDRGLRQSIIPLRSITTGRCFYCRTTGVALIPPRELTEYFELLVSAYRLDASGRPLVQWFRDDWAMFQHPRMDDSRARGLLGDILDDGQIVRRRFIPANSSTIDRVSEWERLRDELMYNNRYFPDATIDLDRLEELLSSLIPNADELPTRWYRARIQSDDTPFGAQAMGAPPNRTASHGRANPAGIPYLYLASTPSAAISEIRPHTAERACVATFTTRSKLRLVDLRNPRMMVSPFLLADAIDIGRMRSDLPFLERLGNELTRPVVPQSAAIDYTPSQYLCEFIKKCGYEGVIYRSSVGNGINLAIFDPSHANCGTVVQYVVTRVNVDVARVD